MVDARPPQIVSAALPSPKPSPGERGQGEGVALSPSLRSALERAVQRAQDWLLVQQHPEGYWWGELESNVTITAEYLLLTHFLGVADQGRWRKIARYIKSKQLADGTWNKFYGGPSDLDTTVEAYFALKLAGEDPNAEPMKQAREFILSRGGIPNVRVFTKCWLALFGQWDWKGVPMMPPEFIFLPKWFPLNIYEFGSWARATMAAMLILMTTRPTRSLPDYASLDELYLSPEERRRHNIYRPTEEALSWKNLFISVDVLLRVYHRLPWKPLRKRALDKCAQWLLAHQEADGSWGGIQPPWVYALMGLHSLGYGLDHPAILKGLQGFEGFAHETEEMFWTESCLSPVWDTALAAIALLDGGAAPDHPALLKAGRWLLKEQVLAGGDWQVKCKAPPGGWSFELHNDQYPDTDDAAEVMMALRRIALPEEEKRRALGRGFRWLVGMQSQNGGWGSFDKDNTRRFVTQIPFADFGETIDPPTEDVTAHIIELFGYMGYDRAFKPVARALEYLRRAQEPDGAWWGRWGVNYIYGIGAVLPALAASGEDMGQPCVRQAVQWLAGHQQPDGGWGESCITYDDPSQRGAGPSTASQTAWALLALIAAGEGGSELARRGVEYLVSTQREDGTWDEPDFTGTGFPGAFLINYHLYRHYWPLSALGRYRKLVQNQRTLKMV